MIFPWFVFWREDKKPDGDPLRYLSDRCLNAEKENIKLEQKYNVLMSEYMSTVHTFMNGAEASKHIARFEDKLKRYENL